jgi:glycosyltransferase involved in cell wall biosynthesis
MDPAPLVTIVIPVYNGANYLREAIDSALAQTYPRVEVLVVNDGSTDGGATAAIARSYGDRIRYVEKANGGVSSALNVGVREMHGEYFSWLSHDDLYRPEKIATQLQAARTHPGAVLYGDVESMDSSGRTLGSRRVATCPRSMRLAIITGDPVHGLTVLIPRACFERVGDFDERLRTIQDYDMWFRLAAHFPFVHVPGDLVRYRVHPAQGTQTIGAHYSECVAQFRRFISELSEREIRAFYSGPLTTFYARLALNMKLRGFDEVAAYALARSTQHAGDAPLTSLLALYATRFACAVLTRKMKPTYWLRRSARDDARSTRPR